MSTLTVPNSFANGRTLMIIKPIATAALSTHILLKSFHILSVNRIESLHSYLTIANYYFSLTLQNIAQQSFTTISFYYLFQLAM